MSLENLWRRSAQNAGVINNDAAHIHETTPAEMQLKDGSPLYYALLDTDPDTAAVLPKADVEQARSLLNGIYTQYPEVVRACDNVSIDVARELLRNALKADSN